MFKLSPKWFIAISFCILFSLYLLELYNYFSSFSIDPQNIGKSSNIPINSQSENSVGTDSHQIHVGTTESSSSFINENETILKKKKHPKCIPDSFLPYFKHKFEPSDVAWRPASKSLFVVSDTGRFAEVDLDGVVLNEYKLGKSYDLEGIALHPKENDIVYLGDEYPATIIRFVLKNTRVHDDYSEQGYIEREWNVQEFLNKVPLTNDAQLSHDGDVTNSGLESLLFLHDDLSNKNYIFVGRQADAKVFVFELSQTNDHLEYRGWIQPPGPGYDLSAMTPWNHKIWLLYDKPKQLISVRLQDFFPNKTNNHLLSLELASLTQSQINTYQLETRGQEGIAFATVGKETFLVVAIDPPSGKGDKNLVKYGLLDFISCFA